MRKAGAKPKPVEIPENNANAIVFLLQAEGAAAFDDITRDGRVTQLSGQGPGDWPNSFRTSRLIPAVEYIRAQRARTLLQQQMNEFMSKWDVVVVPGAGSSMLTITNLTGHPQAVVPCGFLNGNDPQSIVLRVNLRGRNSASRSARVPRGNRMAHHAPEDGLGLNRRRFAGALAAAAASGVVQAADSADRRTGYYLFEAYTLCRARNWPACTNGFAIL